MRRCPYCDEEVRDNAIKCKHCGSMLGEPGGDTLDRLATVQSPADHRQFDTLDIAATQGQEPALLAGQYRIIKKIGEGGMGVVYLAQDSELDNLPVAIKVLPPVLAKNRKAVENLRREALTAIQLNHPNIIRLYGFHSDGDLKFLVMEYIDGQTLEEKLADSPKGKLTLEQTLPIIEQVAVALDYAHHRALPVIHRDLKSSNIMIDKAGRVKVLDFGIAREIHDSYTTVTGKGDTSGTLPYMSPEQVRGQRPAPSMDIYSLGIIAYECLRGRVPFYTGELTYQIIHKPPARIDGVADSVNYALQRILSKEADKRPKTAGDVVHLLQSKSSPQVIQGPAISKSEKKAESDLKASQKTIPPASRQNIPDAVLQRTLDEEACNQTATVGNFIDLLKSKTIYTFLKDSVKLTTKFWEKKRDSVGDVMWETFLGLTQNFLGLSLLVLFYQIMRRGHDDDIMIRLTMLIAWIIGIFFAFRKKKWKFVTGITFFWFLYVLFQKLFEDKIGDGFFLIGLTIAYCLQIMLLHFQMPKGIFYRIIYFISLVILNLLVWTVGMFLASLTE